MKYAFRVQINQLPTPIKYEAFNYTILLDFYNGETESLRKEELSF